MTDLFPSLQIRSADGVLAAEHVDIGWDAWQIVQKQLRPGRLHRWRFWRFCLRAFVDSAVLLHVGDHYQAVRSLAIWRGDDGRVHVRIENYPSRWARYWALLRGRYQTQTLCADSATISALQPEQPLVFMGIRVPNAAADGRVALSLPIHICTKRQQ